MRLYLVASKPTDSVTYGFVPAAGRLGLDVTLLTDKPEAHQRAYATARSSPGRPFPGPLPAPSQPTADEWAHVSIEAADVHDHRSVITALTGPHHKPSALFTNSDHLQAQTALAADYLGLPGKDWRAALRAKDKGLMRRRLAAEGVEHVRAVPLRPGDPEPPENLGYPVVLKPAQGVASEDVVLVRDAAELAGRAAAFFERHPADTLLAEEFLPGTLRTLETIGDGRTRWTLGGFRTTVSPPPYFIEERLTWDEPPPAARAYVETALDALGVSFGACHTEYVTGAEREADAGTRLIEVNDRIIGDHCDFLLAQLTGLPLFELVLQIHLGERLPPVPPVTPGDRRHGVADYLIAERPGLLPPVPAPSSPVAANPGVTLSHWPLARPGDQVTVSGTNRDYLAVLTAAGPSQAAVDAGVSALRERLRADFAPVLGDAVLAETGPAETGPAEPGLAAAVPAESRA
jgi:biotin carboxylase